MKELNHCLKNIKGGICAPKGYLAGTAHANLGGKKTYQKNIAFIASESKYPSHAAAVFTKNLFFAPPIAVTKKHLIEQKGAIQGIIINSRNANACTGDQGIKDAEEMCTAAGRALGIPGEKLAVASTGVIGVPLLMGPLLEGISDAASNLTSNGSHNAALAIMTTDTFPKETALSYSFNELITIGGIAKGSGMVHPNMATILGILTTDACIENQALQQALRKGIDRTFNMISVDGDTSTNDMVIIFSNGAAGNPCIQAGTFEFEIFSLILEDILRTLAKSIASDGEGATKFIEVNVRGASNDEEARVAAKAVSSSLLVKTALFGCDANWGRIACALGYSGSKFNPEEVSIYLKDLLLMHRGCSVPFDEDIALKILLEKEVIINIILGTGPGNATAWGCDLSYDYVKINGSYRS